MELNQIMQDKVKEITDFRIFSERLFIKVTYLDGIQKWEKANDILTTSSVAHVLKHRPESPKTNFNLLIPLNFSYKLKEYKLNKIEDIETIISDLRQKFSITFVKRYKLIKRLRRLITDIFKGYASLQNEGSQLLFKRFENIYFNLYNWLKSTNIEDYANVDPLNLSRHLLFPLDNVTEEFEKVKIISFFNVLEIVRANFKVVLKKQASNQSIWPKFAEIERPIEASEKAVFQPESEKLFRILDVHSDSKKTIAFCKFYSKSPKTISIYCKTVNLRHYVRTNMQEIMRFFRFHPELLKDMRLVRFYKTMTLEKIKKG